MIWSSGKYTVSKLVRDSETSEYKKFSEDDRTPYQKLSMLDINLETTQKEI